MLLAALLLISLPSSGQVSWSDLDRLERHRQSRQGASVLQSIDEPDTSARRWDTPLIGTWDFLDDEERKEDELTLGYWEEDSRIYIERLSFLPKELQVPYNGIIEKQIYFYTTAHAGAMRHIIGKYKYLGPTLRQIFRSQGLPEDLTILAVVESALSRTALSPAGAAGIWQLMPDTARSFGLECGLAVDERYELLGSTVAAAKYLKKMYKRYGSWPLAISSYNSGPGAIDKAVKKAGSTAYWDIYEYLPGETRGYLPAFIAAMYTIYFHELHGLVPKRYSETKTQAFQITKNTSLQEISKSTDIPVGELRRLNPQYRNGIIPGNEKKYILYIPETYAKRFKKK